MSVSRAERRALRCARAHISIMFFSRAVRQASLEQGQSHEGRRSKRPSLGALMAGNCSLGAASSSTCQTAALASGGRTISVLRRNAGSSSKRHCSASSRSNSNDDSSNTPTNTTYQLHYQRPEESHSQLLDERREGSRVAAVQQARSKHSAMIVMMADERANQAAARVQQHAELAAKLGAGPQVELATGLGHTQTGATDEPLAQQQLTQQQQQAARLKTRDLSYVDDGIR